MVHIKRHVRRKFIGFLVTFLIALISTAILVFADGGNRWGGSIGSILSWNWVWPW